MHLCSRELSNLLKSKVLIIVSGTLVNLTIEFLKNIQMQNKIEIPRSYENFLDRYVNLSDIQKFYLHLTSKIKEGIIKLQKVDDFNLIHNWILNLSVFGQRLQQRPKENILIGHTVFITNELVQMGILMINGDLNYYITSYYHLLAYLEAIKDDYSVFLNEILTNRYFKLLCGYHSGLGYVFEEILLATIMQLKETIHDTTLEIIPFNQIKTYSVEKITSYVDYTTKNIENNTIYHMPLQSGVDFIIRDDDKIILMQVTTNKDVNLKKIGSMDKIYSDLHKNQNQNCKIIKWFISLSQISENVLSKVSKNTKQDLLITAADDLSKILSKEMYKRLNTVKEEIKGYNL